MAVPGTVGAACLCLAIAAAEPEAGGSVAVNDSAILRSPRQERGADGTSHPWIDGFSRACDDGAA